MTHIELHDAAENQSLMTAGRLRECAHGWRIFNAFIELKIRNPSDAELVDGALVRVGGYRHENTLVAESIQVVHRPTTDAPSLQRTDHIPLGAALRARHDINARIRHFFEARRFLEVETQALVRAPGTDPHIEPVRADFFDPHHAGGHRKSYLHTSPELSMKRLLAAGTGPIYQLGPVWRNGEVTELHNPEFTMLEWYRPWSEVDQIIDDVQDLVTKILSDESDRPVDAPITRITMQHLVDKACGFDLLEALDTESLRAQIERLELLSPRQIHDASWDELFYALAVTHLDPYLEELGAVFVTKWPTPLAVLAKRDADDRRVAERFELYVDGVELANGFGELTDPVEQRRRFEDDNARRRELGYDEMPMPEEFLAALKRGMPPSAGVALGVDRLLMLATPGATTLRDIAPFALTRQNGAICW